LYFDLVVKQIAVNKEAQEYTNKLRENCLNVLEKLLYVVEQQWRVFKECQNSIYDARDKYADRLKSNDHKLAGKINIGIGLKFIYPSKIYSILRDSHLSARELLKFESKRPLSFLYELYKLYNIMFFHIIKRLILYTIQIIRYKL